MRILFLTIALVFLSLLATAICVIWFTLGLLISHIALDAEAYWFGYGALALGCAPTALVLTWGIYLWRTRPARWQDS